MEFESLKRIAKENLEIIEESHVFLAICTDNFTDNPICLMQLGLSLLLDKPMFLLFAKGFAPPKNLIRALAGYEFIENDDENSIREATKKLKDRIERYLISNNIK